MTALSLPVTPAAIGVGVVVLLLVFAIEYLLARRRR